VSDVVERVLVEDRGVALVRLHVNPGGSARVLVSRCYNKSQEWYQHYATYWCHTNLPWWAFWRRSIPNAVRKALIKYEELRRQHKISETAAKNAEELADQIKKACEGWAV
jgi:hypothetical protein